MRRNHRRLTAAAAAATCLAIAALTAADAVEETIEAEWETTVPGILDASEFPVTVVAAPTAANAGDGVYTFATATKPTILQSAAVRDHDVVVSAFHPDGTLRYSEVFSEGDGSDLGRDEVLVDAEVDGNNNLAYLLIQSGQDALYRKVATNDGQKAGGTGSALDLPGVIVNDIERTSPGGWLGVVGRTGSPQRFYVASIANGTAAFEFQDTPVVGVANAVAMPDGATADRTMVATGERHGFDLQGIHTVGYSYRPGAGPAPRWARTLHDPDSRVEEGIAIDLADVDGLGRRAFVAAQTYTPATGFDTIILAYDDADGSDAWPAPVRIAGPVGGDDMPVAIEHHDGVVYVTGTIDLGGTDDDQVLVVALDAATGTELARVTIGGTIANGDDVPTDLHVTHDRVLVTAQVHQLGTGRRAGLLAFDHDLRPAGAALLLDGPAGGGGDRIAGVDVTIDGGIVVAGARQFPGAGFDVVAARYDRAALVVIPAPTELHLELPATGIAREPVDVTVVLTDDTGAPVSGADVVLDTIGAGTDGTWVVHTDPFGRAAVQVTPTTGGTIDVTAHFAGTEQFEPSDAGGAVAVARRTPVLDVEVRRTASGNRVVITLSDPDGSRVAARTITLSVGDTVVAERPTDDQGQIVHRAKGPHQHPGTTFRAVFAGDEVYAEASATGT